MHSCKKTKENLKKKMKDGKFKKKIEMTESGWRESREERDKANSARFVEFGVFSVIWVGSTHLPFLTQNTPSSFFLFFSLFLFFFLFHLPSM